MRKALFPTGILQPSRSSATRSQEVIGRNLHEMLAPKKYLDAHLQAFPEFVRTGQGNAVGKTVELTALRKDGVEISVALSLSSFSRHGEWHAVGILRDITEAKRAEAELQQLNEALERQTVFAEGNGRRGRDGKRRQERIPGQHEPRDPHADERRYRDDRFAAGHGIDGGATPLRRNCACQW